MRRYIFLIIIVVALLTTGSSFGFAAGSELSFSRMIIAQTAVEKASGYVIGNRPITILMFSVVIGLILAIVIWASRRTQNVADFYSARGAITGTQNGWAIAGDFLSAASFLGVSGLIALFGFDGFMYAIGAIVAYVTVLLIVAEPCRNTGRYTVGDVVSFRSSPRIVRGVVACSTILISTLYLTAQMVGAGKLINLLLDIPYKWAIIGVGSLMVVSVTFGGMYATTWVQIIKAALLMVGVVVLTTLVGSRVGFDPLRLFADVTDNQYIKDWVQLRLLNDAIPKPGLDYGTRFLQPGLLLKDVWDQLSLGMAFVLGTAGMPHILMRFFTVPTAQDARKSVLVAMFIIGIFFIFTLILGMGSALFVGPQKIFAVDKGGNMAVLLLSQKLGSMFSPIAGDLLLAFLCAVAFVTILAVVSGLVLASAGAMSHDIYVNIIKKGAASPRAQMRAAQITSLAVGIPAILVGMAAEKQNVAHIGVLAFALASSGNLPAVTLSLFWRKMNTAGICGGLIVGTLVCLGLVMVSPNVNYPKLTAERAQKTIIALEQKQANGETLNASETDALTQAQLDYADNNQGKSMFGLDRPLFPLKNPGIVSIPVGFLAAIFFALAFPNKKEEQAFDELYVKQITGIGVSKAISH